MANNSARTPGTGEDIRSIDKSGVKTQVVTLDVGGSGAESLVSGTVPVSGSVTVSNFPDTQPVSIAATVPVSGTFWQATQPVSIAAAVPVTDNGGSLTVDGSVSVSNFPATQPVSGTVTANTGLTQPLTNTELRAANVSVIQASTYTTGNITAANANLLSGTATAGSSVQVTVPDGHSSWDVYLAGTWSAATILHFQGSLNGTDWFALNGRRNTSAATNSATNLVDADPPGGATGSPSNWRGSIGAIRFFRVTCSPFTAADNITVQIATSAGVGTTFFNAGLPASTNVIGQVALAGQKATYSASFDAVANVLATDIFVLNGAASRKIEITRLGIVAVSTAAANVRLNLVKRSGAYAGGTSATATSVPLDSANVAPLATFRNYSVAATTIPTLIGIVRALRIPTAVPAGVTAPQDLTLGIPRGGQGGVLRSATEHFALNAPVAPTAGATWTVDVEWTEEVI